MKRALLAGAFYAIALFALGFVLGTLRVLLVIPMLGELGATLIELPLMLTAAYFVCRLIVRRWHLPADRHARAPMSFSFLLLLLSFETVLGLTMLNRTLAEQTAAFVSLSGIAGLAAQAVSALFVFVVERPDRR